MQRTNILSQGCSRCCNLRTSQVEDSGNFRTNPVFSSSGLLIGPVDEEPSNQRNGSEKLKHCVDETDIPLLLVPHIAELKAQHGYSFSKISEIKVLPIYFRKRFKVLT